MNRDQLKGAALPASDQGRRADPADETVINGAPYDPSKAMGGAAAVAGRAAYREEYLRDHGPDLDERLDGTESGQEI
jgi:hypothetical protein